MTNTFPIEVRHNDTLISFTIKPVETALKKYYEVWRHGALAFKLDCCIGERGEELKPSAEYEGPEYDKLLMNQVADIIMLEEE